MTFNNVASAKFTNYLFNDTYTTTIGGNIISYNIDGSSYADLLEVMLKFFAAFENSDLVRR